MDQSVDKTITVYLIARRWPAEFVLRAGSFADAFAMQHLWTEHPEVNRAARKFVADAESAGDRLDRLACLDRGWTHIMHIVEVK